MSKKEKYYLGLYATSSAVGYAVTDTEYRLKSFAGDALWGVQVFDPGKSAEERRQFRTARHRIDRMQMRVQLVQELLGPELAKLDPNFLHRVSTSYMIRSEAGEDNIQFNDADYTDKDFNKQFPTIHHLLQFLMTANQPYDLRFLYIGISWLMKHRGNFLLEIDKYHISEVYDFSRVYNELMEFCADAGFEPWHCSSPDALGEILKGSKRITGKETDIYELLYAGSKPKDDFSVFPYSRIGMIRLLCGGKYALSKLFGKEEYKTLSTPSISLDVSDEILNTLYDELDSDAVLVQRLKAIYDWALLNHIVKDFSSVSAAKVALYDQHHSDLWTLRCFIRKYLPEKYDEVFKSATKNNYTSYGGNNRKCKVPVEKKASQEAFCTYIEKLIEKISIEDIEPADMPKYQDMTERLKNNTFMPKQKSKDNRVIPYQLYWDELNTILVNAENFFPFLSVPDSDGLTVSDKIRSVFEYKIPYYVGPLNTQNRDNSWIVKKHSGRLLPWNFNQIVDLSASEQAFIQNLTNFCLYYPGEKVLPESSILYQHFIVLNELNQLRFNNLPLPVKEKQEIFLKLCDVNKGVSLKKIREYLVKHKYIKAGEEKALAGQQRLLRATSSRPSISGS